jgi:tRNA(Ser,Leu) C12 N-acetylase TAN1
MNVYTQEEVDRINKIKETNDRLESFFLDKRTEWNKTIEPLFEILKFEMNSETSKKIMEIQSLCLSYRQMITEQISVFLDKRSKQEVKLKRLKQDKFIWYATGFGIKTNMGEKTLLIEAHVAEEQRNIELIENYIEFLRQSNKNLESLQYTIKNIIDLFNYLGKI